MAEEIINAYGDDLQTIVLLRGPSNHFEVTVDGQKIYSKVETKRHPQPGEIIESIRSIKG